MRLVQAVSSVARLPIFFFERGLSAAASAIRLVGRVGDRRTAPPHETVWPPPEPEVVEREVVEREVVEREVVEQEPPEPVHVSEEPVLVAEVADTGAEDGAGAELRIDEPWEGYRAMTASEIRRRLRQADAATAAAVRLYEAANKGRSTVLQAAGSASATPSG
jgi:hypothetical protein